jgi:hypothetical protein
MLRFAVLRSGSLFVRRIYPKSAYTFGPMHKLLPGLLRRFARVKPLLRPSRPFLVFVEAFAGRAPIACRDGLFLSPDKKGGDLAASKSGWFRPPL